MSDNLAREIFVSCTPAEAYTALTTGFNKWWTTDCGQVSKPGDEISFHFDPAYWKMRADKLVPAQQVELTCIEAHHVHDGLPASILTEWQGSRLKWRILPEGEKTRVTFIHEGLVPSLNCYEVCAQGWDFFFITSLKQYLESGSGSPFENPA